MLLKNLINKSVYGSIGYISSQEDIDQLEQYILYNLPVLKEYINIITSTTYIDNNSELRNQLKNTWVKYFPNSIHIDIGISRGHSFGTADNDNALFDYCKENNIEWLCKSTNDMIIQGALLDKEIEEADFYYLIGISYEDLYLNDFNYKKILNKFFPQTNLYFINVSKCDYLNDKNHITEIYNKVQTISDYNGKAWEYGFKSCETLLAECVKRNNLIKSYLLNTDKHNKLCEAVNVYEIGDPSHKNIMIDGICHFHNSKQQIIEI
jgi:hypothetical protein